MAAQPGPPTRSPRFSCSQQTDRPCTSPVGTFLYLATQGLCWARSVALIIEIVGPETRDATLYSLLNAAFSIPVLYVVWLDGAGFRHFGTHGLLLTDALLNFLIFGIVTTVFIAGGMGLRRLPDAPALEPEPAAARFPGSMKER